MTSITIRRRWLRRIQPQISGLQMARIDAFKQGDARIVGQFGASWLCPTSTPTMLAATACSRQLPAGGNPQIQHPQAADIQLQMIQRPAFSARARQNDPPDPA